MAESLLSITHSGRTSTGSNPETIESDRELSNKVLTEVGILFAHYNQF